uniref:Putative tiorf105 protein n=1 Tax=Rhizobium rhizogenes TaxID=359 RepID=A0A4P8DK57_RHIRH|nr:putative tiorf105 protein [Rhizobium rhizogenes]
MEKNLVLADRPADDLGRVHHRHAVFGVAAIPSLGVLPLPGETILKTIRMFCVLILAPLAALAEIAPPIVTREEVRWRNRNSETLFEGAVIWEDIAFLPPILTRIRSTTGKRRQQADERDTAANARTVST